MNELQNMAQKMVYPEHLAPIFNWPAIGGPLVAQQSDARCDIEKLLADQRTAFAWAQAEHLAVLSMNADRNGAYLVIAPSARLAGLFGDEMACVLRRDEGGVQIKFWMGCIDHIRIFWREVTCVH